MSTGNLWIPGIQRQDFGRDGGSFTRSVAIICLHSTETGSYPAYDGGAKAPHITIDVKKRTRRQHIGFDRAARALAHPSGTPETNRAGVIQIEMIGSCDKSFASKYGYHYLPDMSVEEAEYLRETLLDINMVLGTDVALVSSVDWVRYPDSYGAGEGQRLSRSAFASYKGVLGHQHVPDNTHGDPGDLPIDMILDPSGDDMPSAEEIAAAVWRYDQNGGAQQAWAYQRDGAKKVWQYDKDGEQPQAYRFLLDGSSRDDVVKIASAAVVAGVALAAYVWREVARSR